MDKNEVDWKPKYGMEFDYEEMAFKFYNEYGRRVGFSVRKDHANRSPVTGEVTSRLYVCCKEGFRRKDKRDYLTKNPRAETRMGCGALMNIKLNRSNGKFWVNKFVEQHNHSLVMEACVHMMPSQRKISTTQAIEVDLADESGIPLRSSYELLGRHAGGRECLGYTKRDQKNYIRSKRQRDLAYGEAGSLLKYFQKQCLENPSFFYAVQLDKDEQITNIFWADARMIIDYGQFGDVVSFDTTYKLNQANRPFAPFAGFNHHRETVIFGAALMYDETIDSFIWLFETFLEAMSNKKPKTIFTDQDAAMAKALTLVMPETCHQLCTWHIMQNAVKHLSILFRTSNGIKAVLTKLMDDYEEENEFTNAWDDMLSKYNVRENTWLHKLFELRAKWAKAYLKGEWSAGMRSTQLSESLNASLKDYLKSDHDLPQFFKHFERMLHDKRYKELEAEYGLCYKLPKIKMHLKMLVHAGTIYTNAIFEEFQRQYEFSMEADIKGCKEDGEIYMYTVDDNQGRERQVKRFPNDFISCSCGQFEMMGVLCSHIIKILREIIHIKEIPSAYILKRWTRDARVGLVQDNCGREIQVDINLEMASRYKNLCYMFTKISSLAAETDESYKVALQYAHNLSKVVHDIQKLNLSGKQKENIDPNSSFTVCDANEDRHLLNVSNGVYAKGLKKREASRGRRRFQSPIEKALRKKRNSLTRPSQGAEIPTKSTFLKENTSNTSVMCPTFNGWELPNAYASMSVEHSQPQILNQYSQASNSNQYSQASNSPLCPQTIN